MENHPEIKYGKTGVLIINLGTPDSTNWFDVRRYLKEFLSDRRVIEVNPIIWQVILNLFILNFRMIFHYLKSLTNFTNSSTISIFVSGKIPCPRLNT